MKTTIALGLLVLLCAGPAVAGEEPILEGSMPAGVAPTDRADLGFVELNGGYGFQLGEQEYLPTSGGDYKHPLTNGFAIGVTGGWEFLRGLALIGNWEWASSSSREGEVPNAYETVEGTIAYHTIAVGVRWTRALGPGRLSGELAGGVLLPFETVVHYDYADAMSGAVGASSGRQVDEYNLGFGAYGQLGYQWDLLPRLYVTTALRLKSFQSHNDGAETRYEDVVRLTDQGPQMVNTTVAYDSDGPVAPRTYSVQDLRLQIAFGFRL